MMVEEPDGPALGAGDTDESLELEVLDLTRVPAPQVEVPEPDVAADEPGEHPEHGIRAPIRRLIDLDELDEVDDDAGVVEEAARTLQRAGKDLLDPVGSILEDQATRMERVRDMVRELDSRVLRAILAADGVAAVLVSGTALIFDLASPYLYLLMELLIAWALLRYIRASVERLKLRRWVRGLWVTALSVAWAWLLHNRMGPEPDWIADSLSIRADLSLPLWPAVALHLAVAAGLALHLVAPPIWRPIWRMLRRA